MVTRLGSIERYVSCQGLRWCDPWPASQCEADEIRHTERIVTRHLLVG